MAHAGTATNLTKQPTTSTKGIVRAIMAAVLVLAVAAGVAVTANMAGKASVVPAVDNSWQIPSQPGLDIHRVVGHRGAMIYQ